MLYKSVKCLFLQLSDLSEETKERTKMTENTIFMVVFSQIKICKISSVKNLFCRFCEAFNNQ